MVIGGGRKGNRPSALLPLPISNRNISGLEFLVSRLKQRIAPEPNRYTLPFFQFCRIGRFVRSRVGRLLISLPACLAFSVPLCLSGAFGSIPR